MKITLPGIDKPIAKPAAPKPKAPAKPAILGKAQGSMSNSLDPHGPMYARQDPPRKPAPKGKRK